MRSERWKRGERSAISLDVDEVGNGGGLGWYLSWVLRHPT